MTDTPLNVEELYATPDSAMTNPVSEPSSPPAPRRTKIPYGIGLTFIICASLSLAFGFPQILMTAFDVSINDLFITGAAAQNDLFVVAKKLQLETKWITLASNTVYLALSIYALFAGIWLKRYQERGRRHVLLWSKLALVYLVAGQIIFFTLLLPLYQETYRSMSLPDTTGMMIVSGVFGALFSAALPVIALLLVGRRYVADACVAP